MNTPEIWVRESKDMEVTQLRKGRLWSLRMTDESGAITVRHLLTRADLRSLRKWIKRELA